MSEDFGVPPIAADNRRLVEQRLSEVSETGGVPETATVEFRDQRIHVPVISMPTNRLFYNPGTHRVRAQRSHDPARDAALAKDPWADESQEYLDFLLKALPSDPLKSDPSFELLMESLRADGQNEAGLITRDGIIVNANTRQAALKQLGTADIRVGVLPASCTWADIHSIELALQLRPDRRREYSYVNHLLAVEEQTALGLPSATIARNFRTTTPALERDMWILNQLRDLIKRSKSNERSLRLMDFENAKERFFELYRAYSKQKAKNKEHADLLKENRLAAIVLDFAKTDLRFIEPDFQARYLDPRLPEADAAEETAPERVAIPGLNRTVKPVGSKVGKARSLTDRILQAKAVRVAGGNAVPAELTSANGAFDGLQEVFKEALDFAGRNYSLRKKRQVARDRIADAAKDLEQCITDLVLARGNGSLDEGSFDDALVDLRTVMGRLADEAERSIPDPGEGVQWLRSASAAG